MDNEIEVQIFRLLKKLSVNEQAKNLPLKRQTERLMLALFYMKALISLPATMTLAKG